MIKDIEKLVKGVDLDDVQEELTEEDVFGAADTIKNTTNEIVGAFDKDLITSDDTLVQLSALMRQSVQKQMIMQPTLFNLQNKLFETLSKPEEIANMDYATLIKLAEVAHRLSSQPLDQLVKLAQVIRDLQDINELTQKKDALEALAAELQAKVDQVNANTFEHTEDIVEGETTIDVEVK